MKIFLIRSNLTATDELVFGCFSLLSCSDPGVQFTVMPSVLKRVTVLKTFHQSQVLLKWTYCAHFKLHFFFILGLYYSSLAWFTVQNNPFILPLWMATFLWLWCCFKALNLITCYCFLSQSWWSFQWWTKATNNQRSLTMHWHREGQQSLCPIL